MDGPWRVSTDPQAPPRERRFAVGPRGLLAVVAGGAGEAGALASRLAVAEIYGAMAFHGAGEQRSPPTRFAQRLRDAVRAANTTLHAVSLRGPECRGMTSTVAAAGLLGRCAYLARAGDASACLVRAGAVHPLPLDANPVAAPKDARPRRSARALGMGPRLRIEVAMIPVRPGDVLVLCAHGSAAVQSAAEGAREPRDAAALCATLVDGAVAAGASESVTIVVAVMDGGDS